MAENKVPIETLGAIFSPTDVRDYVLKSTSETELPEVFELNMVRIKDQGSVGSCVAHALAEVVEYYNSVQIDNIDIMSTGYIYGNRNGSLHKDSGMIVRDALKNLQKYGDVPKNNFRENVEVPEAIELFDKRFENLRDKGTPFRISSYAKIKSTDVETIKKSIFAGNPVVMAMNWYKDMKVVDGILTSTFEKANQSGGHCMVIYGWAAEGWKVQNSWGRYWGTKGTCIIPYDISLSEVWTITDTIIDGTEIDTKFTSKIGEMIAKIINAILKMIKK